ncbi:type II toxin-antitoxin system Phd/YefM family antitoxin [Candidatus Sumerlaeota bacterium]|nr:type II toxin-antitoxin system Phd/YefM family antitoxin [Candidatus Sumerlaeota bacterium]
MQKSISTQELKTHVGEVVDAVRLRGDRYVIERRGKAVAAIVPLCVNESDRRNRSRLFELIESAHEKNRGIPAERIQAAIDKAIAVVRRPTRKQGKRA